MEEVKSFTFLKTTLKKERSQKYLCFFISLVAHLALIIPAALVVQKDHFHFKTLNFAQSLSQKISVRVKRASAQNDVQKLVTNKKAKAAAKKSLAKKSLERAGAKKEVLKNTGSKTILAEYISRLRMKIDQVKKYPRLAKRLKHQGLVKLEILINKDGKILSNEFIVKSNSVFLNKAAEDIFLQLKKFDAPPKEIAQRPLRVIVPISYRL